MIFQKNTFFEFLADSLTADHMDFDRLKTFDGSVVIKDLIERLGVGSLVAFLPKYLLAAQSAGRLEFVVPNQLLAAIRLAKEEAINPPSPDGERSVPSVTNDAAVHDAPLPAQTNDTGPA